MTFIICFLTSCFSEQKYVRQEDSKLRSIASSYGVEFTEEQWSISTCTEESQEFCYNEYPFEDIEKSFFESDSAFKKRDDKIKMQYSQCIVKNTYVCAANRGQEGAAERLLELEAQIDASGKDEYSQLLRFTKTQMLKTWEYLKSIKKVVDYVNDKKINMLHGVGAATGLSATAGVMVDYKEEYLLHGKNIGIFCAPGFGMSNSFSLAVSVSVLKTYDCKNNDAYKGGFLTLGLELNGSTFGLPAGGAVSYNLGFDARGFIDGYKELKENEGFSPIHLRKELKDLALTGVSLILKSAPPHNLKQQEIFAVLAAGYLAADMKRDQEAMSELKVSVEKIGKKLGRSFLTKKSIGNYIKGFIESERFKEVMFAMDYKNIYYFVEQLSRNLSGCDAVGLTGLLGPSSAPVGLTAYLSHYILLEEFYGPSFLKLVKMGPFAMINPFFIDKEDAKEYLKFVKFVMNKPEHIGKRCLTDGAKQAFKNLRDLINLR